MEYEIVAKGKKKFRARGIGEAVTILSDSVYNNLIEMEYEIYEIKDGIKKRVYKGE